jgi:hypothetical protein
MEDNLRLYEIALNTARKLERARLTRLLKEELALLERTDVRKIDEPSYGLYLGLKRALAVIADEERS